VTFEPTRLNGIVADIGAWVVGASFEQA